jgi:ferredoxin
LPASPQSPSLARATKETEPELATASGGYVRVVVDRDLCESNAVCMSIEPSVFEVDDDDELQILNEHPDESLRPKMEEAVRRCPKQALSIEED